MIPAAGEEYDPDHEPQQEEPDVREFIELGKHAETFRGMHMLSLEGQLSLEFTLC